jgi:outer membrane protein TolC
MKKILTPLLLLLVGSSYAQTHLEQYIRTGLSSNETIRQQQFLLDKSLWALKEAKSLFLPNVELNGSYTLAGGGRTVDIPVGDLMNPVYKTLNQLTGTNNFPQIQNQSVLLNPNNFYDVKLHTTFPVINAEIAYNKKIKSQQYDLQKIETGIYKRELVKEIKIAYYNYLQATTAIGIYENALALVKENERINTSLFNNQKVNRTAVVRSNNEVTKITAQLKYTRNPMYLGLITMLTGTSVLLGTFSPLIVIPIIFLILHTQFVLREEKWMAEWFGEPYLVYKKKTPRWL